MEICRITCFSGSAWLDGVDGNVSTFSAPSMHCLALVHAPSLLGGHYKVVIARHIKRWDNLPDKHPGKFNQQLLLVVLLLQLPPFFWRLTFGLLVRDEIFR